MEGALKESGLDATSATLLGKDVLEQHHQVGKTPNTFISVFKRSGTVPTQSIGNTPLRVQLPVDVVSWACNEEKPRVDLLDCSCLKINPEADTMRLHAGELFGEDAKLVLRRVVEMTDDGEARRFLGGHLNLRRLQVGKSLGVSYRCWYAQHGNRYADYAMDAARAAIAEVGVDVVCAGRISYTINRIEQKFDIVICLIEGDGPVPLGEASLLAVKASSRLPLLGLMRNDIGKPRSMCTSPRGAVLNLPDRPMTAAKQEDDGAVHRLESAYSEVSRWMAGAIMLGFFVYDRRTEIEKNREAIVPVFRELLKLLMLIAVNDSKEAPADMSDRWDAMSSVLEIDTKASDGLDVLDDDALSVEAKELFDEIARWQNDSLEVYSRVDARSNDNVSSGDTQTILLDRMDRRNDRATIQHVFRDLQLFFTPTLNPAEKLGAARTIALTSHGYFHSVPVQKFNVLHVLSVIGTRSP